MKKIVLIVLMTLALSACSSGITEDEFNTLSARIDELENSLEEANLSVESLEATKSELLTTIADRDEIILATTTERDDYKADIIEKQRELSSMMGTISFYECDDQLNDMNYQDIFSASTNLMAWVTNQEWALRASSTIRDAIWNNTDTKLHGVYYIDPTDNEMYVSWFLVYFDEFGWREGVFWLDKQCWLETK